MFTVLLMTPVFVFTNEAIKINHLTQLQSCVADIKAWMTHNFLLFDIVRFLYVLEFLYFCFFVHPL